MRILRVLLKIICIYLNSDTYHYWDDDEPNHQDGEDCVDVKYFP